MTASLRAGVGRVDITPPLGSELMGYPSPGRTATSVRDPLNATALVLEQDGLKAAIITADLCVPVEADVALVRRKVHEATGIEPAHVTVSYSHTHSGPNTQDCWGWCQRDAAAMELAIGGMVEATAKAHDSLQPVRVGIGTTQSDVGVNRREINVQHQRGWGVNPWGAYDPEMTVLRFAGADGPVATLIHYGAHPTVFDGSNRAISRDWPGVMVDRVEQLTKTPALYVNGALGDVAPRTNAMKNVGDGEFSLLEVGTRAAMDAMRAYRWIKEFRSLDLGVVVGPADIPVRPLPSAEEARKQIDEWKPKARVRGSELCELLHWQAVLKEIESGRQQSSKAFEQTITSIGPVAFVPIPGEPFSELVLRIRRDSPFQYTLCASATNGSNGYFCTREALHRGGYEVWVARAFGAYLPVENIDDVLVDANLALLRQAHARVEQTV